MSGAFALDTTGKSISDLMQNVAGRAQIDLDSGEITSLDLETLFGLGTSRRQESMTEADTNAPLDGASVGLKITGGRAEIENGRLQTKGMRLSFGGRANLAERTFDLWALTQERPASDTTTKPNTPTRVTLTGSWDAPSLLLEPMILPVTPAKILPRLGTKPDAVMSYAPGWD